MKISWIKQYVEIFDEVCVQALREMGSTLDEETQDESITAAYELKFKILLKT